jgi:hypothetical protein
LAVPGIVQESGGHIVAHSLPGISGPELAVLPGLVMQVSRSFEFYNYHKYCIYINYTVT